MGQQALSFEQVETHLRQSLKQKGGWNGPDIEVDPVSAVSSPPSWHLSAEGLEYHKANGRKLVDVLFMVAYQAGYAAGLEKERETVKFENIIEDIRKDISA